MLKRLRPGFGCDIFYLPVGGTGEDAKLVLIIVLHADRGMLQIGRFKEKATAGHRSRFEIAVKDESFGKMVVGRFVVSFHCMRLRRHVFRGVTPQPDAKISVLLETIFPEEN